MNKPVAFLGAPALLVPCWSGERSEVHQPDSSTSGASPFGQESHGHHLPAELVSTQRWRAGGFRRPDGTVHVLLPAVRRRASSSSRGIGRRRGCPLNRSSQRRQ